MLAWFKKKFGKQQEPSQAVVSEQAEQGLRIDETPVSPAEAKIASVEDIAAEAAMEADDAGEKAEQINEAAEVLPQVEQAAEVPAQLGEAPAAPVLEPELPKAEADFFADAEESTAETAAIEELAAEQAAASPELSEAAEETAGDEPVEEASLDAEESEDESAAAAEETVPEEEEAQVSSYTQEKPAAKSMFRRLQDRLGKSRSSFVYQLDRLFMGEKEISQDLFDQLEELLITADLGVSTTMDLLDKARRRVKRDLLSDPQALKNILKEEMLAYITASDQPAELVMPEEGPFVIMVVGVNGVGKTTTIGKIAAKFVRSGQSVLLIAGDTFRAAAIDQLKIWGARVGVEVMAQKPGSDPASVVFDGIDYGVAHGKDVILIDTAGRLHTSVNLMEELKKIQRVVGRRLPGAPHEVLQVLDATTGQNGIAQAKLFHEAVGVSGLALTKLDGTAKGGIVANICRELKIPVRFIGVGEQLDDLRDFDAAEFVDALFAENAK